MFDEYNLKIKDKPTYIFQKFKDSGYDEKPKRKPLEDGTLPLTDEEMIEFQKIIGYSSISRVYVSCKWVYFNQFGYVPCTSMEDYKAFSFLNELFDLGAKSE
jgi:hypothetical protein